jgi:hypothetical protein
MVQYILGGAELTEDDQLEPDLWLEELELTGLLGNFCTLE